MSRTDVFVSYRRCRVCAIIRPCHGWCSSAVVARQLDGNSSWYCVTYTRQHRLRHKAFPAGRFPFLRPPHIANISSYNSHDIWTTVWWEFVALFRRDPVHTLIYLSLRYCFHTSCDLLVVSTLCGRYTEHNLENTRWPMNNRWHFENQHVVPLSPGYNKRCVFTNEIFRCKATKNKHDVIIYTSASFLVEKTAGCITWLVGTTFRSALAINLTYRKQMETSFVIESNQ